MLHDKLCISLSGGVDSMVLLHKLKYDPKFVVKTKELTAVHINYNNRPSCSKEVEFVKEYCNTHGVELFIEDISHITRTRDGKRAAYEEETRKIRFSAYVKQKCPVLLGHNYEDTVENIISNISSKKNLHDLKGMSFRSCEKDVEILRPMLETSKADIYEYAYKHSIPHLEDSTPKWSRRGKLRDHVIPTLETFEPDFIKGLITLTNNLQQNFEFIQKHPNAVELPKNFLNVKQRMYASNKSIEASLSQK